MQYGESTCMYLQNLSCGRLTMIEWAPFTKNAGFMTWSSGGKYYLAITAVWGTVT
jgi:hypothetical protein